MKMKYLQFQQTNSEIAIELQLPVEDVDNYFQYYYINRFFPIRDILPIEMALVNEYNELKYASPTEVMQMCQNHGVKFQKYVTDRWLLPKAVVHMRDEHYDLLMNYTKIILEPYLNYGNSKAPRLSLLTKEEIALLLSNIATGQSIIPGDTVTIRTSMEAMDRLYGMYDDISKRRSAAGQEDLKEYSPKELMAMAAHIKAEQKGGTTQITVKAKEKKSIKPKKIGTIKKKKPELAADTIQNILMEDE